MNKIKEFNIARLRIEEDFGFQKRIEAETALLTVEADKPMVDSYKAALTAFDDALKGSARNSQSPPPPPASPASRSRHVPKPMPPTARWRSVSTPSPSSMAKPRMPRLSIV